MEDTAYNKKILDQVRAINRRYIKDAEMKGQMLDKMAITKPTIGRGADFEGAGILDTLGSLAPLAMLALGKPKKSYRKMGGIETGGRRKMAGAMTGQGFLDDLADAAQSVGSTALSLAPLLALGKPRRGRKMGGEIALDMRDQNFATPSASGRRRRRGGIATGGIQTGGLSRKLLGARAVGSGLGELEGAGIFDDILSGINNTIGVASQAKALHSMLKGKGKKKMGGIATGGRRRRGGIATGGEMDSEMMAGIATGGRRRRRGGIATGGEMDSEMMGAGIFDDILGKVSDTLSTVSQGAQLAKQFGFLKGKGKKKMGGIATGGKSPWISHVKAFAKKHGMKYNEALKDPRTKAAYKA
jgi:hypothetical protein